MSTTVLIVLSGLSALVAGLVAGVHVCGSAGLNRALRTLDHGTYVRTKQALDVAFPPLMRPLVQAGLLLAAAVVVVGAVVGDGAAATAGAVALGAAVVVLVAVVRGDLPINQQMAAWGAEAPPADLPAVRRAWERWFTVRTAGACAAFAASLVALVIAAR